MGYKAYDGREGFKVGLRLELRVIVTKAGFLHGLSQGSTRDTLRDTMQVFI